MSGSSQASRRRRSASWLCWIARWSWATSPPVPEVDWRNYRETGPDNTVSGSTTDGGSVLLGKMTVRMTLKSWTIIKE